MGRVLCCEFNAAVLTLLEVEIRGTQRRVVRSAEFTLIPGESLKKAGDTGPELRDFLRKNGFTAKQAYAGLPTQWLMLKDKIVPQVGGENLAGMLRMQAERDFSLPPDELALDYALGTPTDSAAALEQGALLAATSRERLEQVLLLLKSTGLNVALVGSTSLAMATVLGRFPLMLLSGRGTDLVLMTRGGVLRPQVLSAQALEKDSSLAQLGAEAGRALAMSGFDGTSEKIWIWNSLGAGKKQISELSDALGMDAVVLSATPLNATDTALGGALALSFLAEGKQLRSLNFLTSKLTEPKSSRFAIKPWMALCGAAVLLLAGWLGYSALSDSMELSRLRKQSADRKAELDETRQFLARFNSTQSWYDKDNRPNHLNLMMALARVIPEDGSAWIVNLSIKDDSHCVVSMHAMSEAVYFPVIDAMDKDKTYGDVKLLYMTRPDRKKSEVSFAVGFVYTPQKTKDLVAE